MEADSGLIVFIVCGLLASFALLLPRGVGSANQQGYDLPVEPVPAPVGAGCFPAIVALIALFVLVLVLL